MGVVKAVSSKLAAWTKVLSDDRLQQAHALLDAGQTARARALLEAVLRERAGDVDALQLMASIELESGDWATAATRLEIVLAQQPHLASALFNLGLARLMSDALPAALDAFSKAAACDPTHVRARYNQAFVLALLGRPAEAAAQFKALVAVAPEWSEAWSAYAETLFALRETDTALSAVETALKLNASSAPAWKIRGDLMHASGRALDAVGSYDRALRAQPRFPAALHNKGGVLQLLRQFEAAAACYEDELASLSAGPGDPRDFDNALSELIRCRREVCDWEKSTPLERLALERLASGRGTIEPHLAVHLTDDPALLQRAARAAWGGAVAPAARSPRRRDGKIRIGYLSSAFRMHPTGDLTAGLFEAHNRARFEVIAYSVGPDDRSAVRARLERGFDRFAQVADKSDAEIAALIERDDIDVLVDLDGHQLGARLGVLQLRPAPINAHYIGFPGTGGSRVVDYMIGDHLVIADEDLPYYDEAVVRLPGTYQANDEKRSRPMAPTRASIGLPEDQVVLCAFHGSLKLSPACFDAYVAILARAPNTVLWLMADAPVQKRLRANAEARGVDPARLVFAERADHEHHMARKAAADLLLDTWPYGAHTTASEALWVGTPVLTIAGRSFASRVATSLLTSLDLPDLIAANVDAFIETGVGLAADRDRLSSLRFKLAGRRDTADTFRSSPIARHLERAYEIMVERWLRGEAPSKIDLS